MLRSVLVPTDFTEDGVLVAHFAEGLGALGTERVVLAHVLDASGLEAPVIVAEVDRARGVLRKRAGWLEDAGMSVEVRVPTGDPPAELLALAAESHVDAIVLGTHGKAPAERLVAGSVSQALLSSSDRPMLFARFSLLANRAEPASFASRFGERLLLATDFSASATRAFQAVLGLAKGAVDTLTLLHVLDPLLEGERARRAEIGAEHGLRGLAETAEQAGVRATTTIRAGEPAREVLDEMDERRATGAVLGRRGRGALAETLLGGVSLTLTRQASCPVAVVP